MCRAMKNSLKENIDMSFVKDYDKAIASLEVKGKYLETVPRDGNCLFYSISDQLFGH